MAKKVYELANELGIGALDMVEKLKGMGFNVRNHMASLSDEEVNKAKEVIENRNPYPVKKAVVRKVIRKNESSKVDVPISEEKYNRYHNLEAEEDRQLKKAFFESSLATESLEKLFAEYPIHKIEDIARIYEVTLPERVREALSVYHTNPRDRGYVHPVDIFIYEFPEHRKKQFENQLSIESGSVDDPWKRSIHLQAVAAEIAYEKFCLSHGIPYTDLNLANRYDPQDALSGGVRVDVKAKTLSRNQIGWKVDLNLLSKRVQYGEDIVFFHTKHENTNSDRIVCEFIGILKRPKERFEFFNPCFFVNPVQYFKAEKPEEYPPFNKEVAAYLGIKYLAHFLSYYGQKTVIRNLAAFDFNDEFHDLLYRLQILEYKDELMQAPLEVFLWIIKAIERKRDVNKKSFIEEIFPLCCLNQFQKGYLEALLEVFDCLKDFKCKFSGKGVQDCKITYKNGIIVATAEGMPGNTLFAYSWKDGRHLNIKKDLKCKDKNCGCLGHIYGEEIICGPGCPINGKKS